MARCFIWLGATVKDISDNGLAADVVSLAAPGVAVGGTVVRYADDAYAASKAGGNAAWDWGKPALGYGNEASATKAGTDCLINSFSADTLVMTPSGLKPIAELVEGELVLAYNEATGEIGAYPIVDTISHVDPEIVLLTVDGETLETTANLRLLQKICRLTKRLPNATLLLPTKNATSSAKNTQGGFAFQTVCTSLVSRGYSTYLSR